MISLVLFMAVLLGGLASFIIQTQSSLFKLSLAFSGAFLFGTILTHLLPEVFTNPFGSYWVLLGFGIQLVLDFISKGLEHGHLHIQRNKIPLLPLVGLFIHAFIEGMSLGLDGEYHKYDKHHGDGLLWSIAIHKLPIALLVATALRSARLSSWKVISGILIFAICSPLGNTYAINTNFNHSFFLPLLGIAAGLLLHVSTTILFESASNHQFNAVKMVVITVGISLSLFFF